MKYQKTITCKDGRLCLIRNGEENDANEALTCFQLAREETDYLLTYPDECGMDPEGEGAYLKEKEMSPITAELVAILEGKLVGMAGIDQVGAVSKLRHRAEMGVNVSRDCWGLGIGRALCEGCIDLARQAGYVQLELSVVAQNKAAIALYESLGFCEYGRNPKGFLSRKGAFQELVLMRMDL